MFYINKFKKNIIIHVLKIRSCGNTSSNYDLSEVETCFRMIRMVRNFRKSGHFAASLDPLAKSNDIGNQKNKPRTPPWLHADSRRHPDVVRLLRRHTPDLSVYGLENVPLNKPFYLGQEVKFKGREYWTIRDLLLNLRQAYCGSVGVEILHIENNFRRRWLLAKVEGEYGPRNWNVSSPEDKRRSFTKLLESDHTALFLGKRFSSAKIFEIEGCEVLLPALWSIADTASALGVEAVEMGMAHRGRMNVLHNFFEKSFGSICNKFNESEVYSGDVKFHLGARATVTLPGEDGRRRELHLSLCANPSHLEAVYPVVIGKTRAKQFYIHDTDMTRVMPLVIHGDAGFSGQGIVPETMELSNLPDYRVGGAVHIIVNNQIGFTTDPKLARTSYHCTNVAKMIEAPVFHVNGDDVDAVVAVCKLAVEYRQKFGLDVVIDIVCYRRHGHTNKEDPKITQPITYKLIDEHPSTLRVYSEKLVREGIMTQEEIDEQSKKLLEVYAMEYEKSREYVPDSLEWLGSNWQGTAISSLGERPYNQTGVRVESLMAVFRAISTIPDHVNAHPDVLQILEARRKMMETGTGINLAAAELLAFGTLITKFSPNNPIGLRGAQRSLSELTDLNSPLCADEMVPHPTVHVRLSGQDCVRGTFNQRHAGIFCQDTEKKYEQLNNIDVDDEPATFSVSNSSLSEAAVLAFEYGYSLENELALTVWEAQFGDFANVAQAIIDNFIVSGESKWNVHSALVMLLPHGYDGQGPEHSSARIERFLQLVDDREDSIPGSEAHSKDEIAAGFDALAARNPDAIVNGEPVVSRRSLMESMFMFSPTELSGSRLEVSMTEVMDEFSGDGHEEYITKDMWVKMMCAWLQHNSERTHNFSVIVPSTPAQYFHGLRRQIHRSYAKPVAVMTSKWLLHHKPCSSDLEDFLPGTFFRRVIIEGHGGDNMRMRTKQKTDLLPPQEIRKVIFCCGKIFYHMYHARSASGVRDTAFVRLEQIAPFPYDIVATAIQRYPNAELVWAQEEPRNMGAWTYVKPRFDTTLREKLLSHQPIRYVGRGPSAAPATGQYRQHHAEQVAVINAALDLS